MLFEDTETIEISDIFLRRSNEQPELGDSKELPVVDIMCDMSSVFEKSKRMSRAGGFRPECPSDGNMWSKVGTRYSTRSCFIMSVSSSMYVLETS